MKYFFLIALSLIFASCATMNPVKDEYNRYLTYSQGLQASVAAGKISATDAHQLDQQAYDRYLQYKEHHEDQALAYGVAGDALDTMQNVNQQNNFAKTTQQVISQAGPKT